MTDLEIDRSLALAIGWRKTCESTKTFWVVEDSGNRRVFTHKDWNVIGPIAARYDCFPLRLRGGAWEAISRGKYKLGFFNADTPQKAIALAVIGALK
jgi:hypothetical protein